MSTPLPQPLEVPSGPIRPERWREIAHERKEKKRGREGGILSCHIPQIDTSWSVFLFCFLFFSPIPLFGITIALTLERFIYA